VIEPKYRIEIAVTNEEEVAQARALEIMNRLKAWNVFLAVYGEVTGERPTWQLVYGVGSRELLLGVLFRHLDSLDPSWREVLKVVD
jgi:hypothetical protein